MKKITFSFLILMFGINLNSQTLEQRKEITKDYNINKLDSLSKSFYTEAIINKQKASKFALNNNIQEKFVDEKGTNFEMMDVLDSGHPIYYKTYNVGASVTARANHLKTGGSLGLNLHGQNMIFGIWDSGHPWYTHQELVNRVYVQDEATTATSHATHVTGTIMASGIDADAKGIADQTQWCWVNNWTSDIAEMTSQAAAGLLVSNHSYGLQTSGLPLYYYGAYINSTKQVDDVTFNAPFYLPVFAAGNDRNAVPLANPKNGNDLITGKSLSKNGITVAAVVDVPFYFDNSSVTMSTFSNWGPSDDFRIKPDISTKGVAVYSPVATNNTAYSSYSGTSMAAPGVTGVLVLLQQHYNNLNQNFMKAATLKGLIIHTADEAGPNSGPDHMFGWGLINAKKSAEVISQKNISTVINELTLTQGQTYTKTVTVTGGITPLVATISWTDRSGAINSTELADLPTPTLVNDLDIRITKSATVYYPWRLDTNLSNPALRNGDNFRDNVEKIEMAGVSGTDYVITVTHKGSLVGGLQNFSLILSGVQENLSLTNNDFENFKIWPNPTSNVLNISNETSIGNVDIYIYNNLGQVVGSDSFILDANSAQLNVSGLSRGIYMIKLIQDKKEFVKKFIKN